MSFLAGRKFLIVGGNGFVGNRLAAKLIQHSAQVSVLSRKGPRFEYPENKKVNWIIGSAMEPELIKDKINQADTIIHSLGTLIDTSTTKMKSPGETGTYQQMNRDTFLKILSSLETPKKVIYISSSDNLPFFPRYKSTKQQAQVALFNSPHEGYSIRPGFIYDWELKKWSIPFRYVIKGWNQLYNPIHSLARGGTMLQNFIQQFSQSQPTSLNKLVQAIAYVSLQGNDKKIISNKDILTISTKYQKLLQDLNKNEGQPPVAHDEPAKTDSKADQKTEKKQQKEQKQQKA